MNDMGMGSEAVHLRELMAETDRRIEQRFADQQRAVEAALAAQEKAVAAALSASKEAVTKAEQSSTQRLDAHNQLQGKLDRQAATLAEKEWVSSKVEAVERLVHGLEARMDRIEGRGAGISAGWGWLLGAVGLIGALVSLFFALK